MVTDKNVMQRHNWSYKTPVSRCYIQARNIKNKVYFSDTYVSEVFYLSKLTSSDWYACFVFGGPSYSDKNILDFLQFHQENATLVYKIAHDRYVQRFSQCIIYNRSLVGL
jgi:hypothetical protein